MEVDEKCIEVSFGKQILLKNAGLPGGIVRDIRIPVDTKGRVIINYVAPWKDSFFGTILLAGISGFTIQVDLNNLVAKSHLIF